MREDTLAFSAILLVNTLVTLLYWFVLRVVRKEYAPGLAARCTVMLLCPIIGPVYFGFGWLLRKLFFHKPVDLTDVIFSKEREKILLKADEYGESNLVSVEDAVTVLDTESARELMLRVVRLDIRKSLGSILRGLNSNDSEISHYAASMLQSELGKFRNEIQKAVTEIERLERELRAEEDYDGELKTEAGMAYSGITSEASGGSSASKKRTASVGKDPEQRKRKRRNPEEDRSKKSEDGEEYDRHKASAHEQGLRAFYGDDVQERTSRKKLETLAEAAHRIIEEIYEVLRQNVLSEIESARFTELADRMALLLQKRDVLSETEMACLAECYRLRGDYEHCRAWSDQLTHAYPGSLSAFSTRLKLLYSTGEREAFLETLDQMKKTGVPLDHEMMEMVRCFQ